MDRPRRDSKWGVKNVVASLRKHRDVEVIGDHAVFAPTVHGVKYVFNSNDYSGWRSVDDVVDGFQHYKPGRRLIRPLMKRKEYLWCGSRGICMYFAQACSHYFYAGSFSPLARVARLTKILLDPTVETLEDMSDLLESEASKL